MSANGAAYVIPANMEKRLLFWLSMDAWQLDEAAQILSGIDPDKTIKPSVCQDGSGLSGTVTLFAGARLPELPPEPDYKVVHGECLDSLAPVDPDYRLIDEAEQETIEYELRKLEAYFKKCADIARLFNSPSISSMSPKDWIGKALLKGIEIPWLECAYNRLSLQKYLPERAQVKPLQTKERNSLLTIIAALCDYSDIKHQDRGVAQRIMAMTDEIGAHVDDETILSALKQIPAALEARMGDSLEKRLKAKL